MDLIALETLSTIGLVAATPLVTQWVLDLFKRGDEDGIDYFLRLRKQLTAVLVGMALAVTLAVHQNNVPVDVMSWVMLVLDGGAAGAMAAGGYSLTKKIAANVGTAV